MIISLFPLQALDPCILQLRGGALKCATLVWAAAPKIMLYCINLSS